MRLTSVAELYQNFLSLFLSKGVEGLATCRHLLPGHVIPSLNDSNSLLPTSTQLTLYRFTNYKISSTEMEERRTATQMSTYLELLLTVHDTL